MTNEQDTINLQILFGCGKLIVGEWSLDELVFNQKNKEFSKKLRNMLKKILEAVVGHLMPLQDLFLSLYLRQKQH